MTQCAFATLTSLPVIFPWALLPVGSPFPDSYGYADLIFIWDLQRLSDETNDQHQNQRDPWLLIPTSSPSSSSSFLVSTRVLKAQPEWHTAHGSPIDFLLVVCYAWNDETEWNSITFPLRRWLFSTVASRIYYCEWAFPEHPWWT